MSKYSICLKRPKLKTGSIPVQTKSFDTPFDDKLVLDNNNIKHDHNYFKLRLTDAPDENDITENTHIVKTKKTDNTNYEGGDDQGIRDISDLEYFEFEHEVIQIEVEVSNVLTLTLFKKVIENLSAITIPHNWCSDITVHGKKQILSFYKLCPYGITYSRSIEKQLVITYY